MREQIVERVMHLTAPLTVALLLAMLLAPLPVAAAEPRGLETACADAPEGRFPDVEGVHAPGIDCIGWWGVTQGRGDGTYDPAGPVTRAQMATFVARTILLSGGTLPEPGGIAFDDLGDSVHTTAIGQLEAAGVVGGTGPGTYDPEGPVTRAQMGTFLARAYETRTGVGLPIDPDISFPDLTDNIHEDNIRRIATAGLTGGLADGRFDPAGEVTRAQMGTFLARFLAALVAADVAPYPPADPVGLPDTAPEPEPEPAPEPEPEPEPAPDQPPPDDGAEGTRTDPIPIGRSVDLADGVSLSVREVIPDATQIVLDENRFNDPPEPGRRFVIVRVRLTATDLDYGRFDASYRLRTVGPASVAYTTFDTSSRCGVIPDRIVDREVFRGGTVEGNLCWQVPDGDVDGLVLYDHETSPSVYLSLSGAAAPDEPFPTPPAPTGPRATPVAAGSTVDLDDGWQVRVDAYDDDATAEVLAENSFNDPPAEGHRFVIVEVTATWQGAAETSRFDGGYRLRAAGNGSAVTYSTFEDSCGVIPGRIEDPDVFQGGSVSGAVCFEVRDVDAAALVIFDQSSTSSSSNDPPTRFLAVR